MTIKPKTGDIIFYSEGHWRDKIASKVMSSKNIWQFLLNKREIVSYYHTAVFYYNLVFVQKRWGLQLVNWNPNKKQIIFRHKSIEGTSKGIERVKYDFLNCYGHLTAWITNIQCFHKLHGKNRKTCILMVMDYCKENYKEKFPINDFWEWHTQDFFKYLSNSSNYEIIYKKD